MIVQSVVPRVVAILTTVARCVVVTPMTVALHEIAIPMIVDLLGQRSLPQNKSHVRYMPAQVVVVPKEVAHPQLGPYARKLNGSTKVL
jgi:hypothetical protein